MNEEKLFNLLDRLLKQYKDDVIVLNNELKNVIFPDNCFNDDLIRSREELYKTLYDGLRSNFINEVMGKLDGLSGHPIEGEINEIDLDEAWKAIKENKERQAELASHEEMKERLKEVVPKDGVIVGKKMNVEMG